MGQRNISFSLFIFHLCDARPASLFCMYFVNKSCSFFNYQLVRVGAREAAVVKAVLGPGGSVEVQDDVQAGIPSESGSGKEAGRKLKTRTRDETGREGLWLGGHVTKTSQKNFAPNQAHGRPTPAHICLQLLATLSPPSLPLSLVQLLVLTLSRGTAQKPKQHKKRLFFHTR